MANVYDTANQMAADIKTIQDIFQVSSGMLATMTLLSLRLAKSSNCRVSVNYIKAIRKLRFFHCGWQPKKKAMILKPLLSGRQKHPVIWKRN